MKLMLTSFGINETREESINPKSISSLFYRMPPVSLRWLTNTFIPEYSALLLCDKLIIDEVTFRLLNDNPDFLFREVAKTINLLHSEGFVELVDFNGVMLENAVLFKMMLENDLKTVEHWHEPFRQSAETWTSFAWKARELILEGENARDFSEVTFLAGTRAFLVPRHLAPDPENKESYSHRNFLMFLRTYLSYVNANILLSNKLGAGIHDWADFLPFYQKKFYDAGYKDYVKTESIDEVNKLFNVSFPEFTVTDPATLIKILRDKRVDDLRQLVSDAVAGKITFDVQFARNVFKEVLRTEREITWYRNITSYLTLPIDFVRFVPGIGGVIQKGVEELIGSAIESNRKKNYQWFYMLSNLAEK